MIVNQIIHTVVNYESPDEPPPCLLHTPVSWQSRKEASWMGHKVLAAWVNLRTGVPDWRSCSASFWPGSEWVSEHSWEGVKEKGKEGREVRFEEGVGEYTDTHTHSHTHTLTCILLLSTVMGTIGRWRLRFGTGHDPISKHGISHSHRSVILTSATTNC